MVVDVKTHVFRPHGNLQGYICHDEMQVAHKHFTRKGQQYNNELYKINARPLELLLLLFRRCRVDCKKLVEFTTGLLRFRH